MARQLTNRGLPAIGSRAAEAGELRQQRRRLDIRAPAHHAHAVLQTHRRHWIIVESRPTERGGMHEHDMDQIEQIVVVELPIALHRQGLAAIAHGGGESRIVDALPLRQQAFIALGGIAHPQPNEIPALDHRIGFDLRVRRNLRLPRNLDALPSAVEFQAVITAADRIAFAHSHRERQVAMATAIFHRDRAFVCCAIEQYWLAEDGTCHRLLANFRGIGADIPIVTQKHGLPPADRFVLLSGAHIRSPCPQSLFSNSPPSRRHRRDADRSPAPD